MRKLLVVAVCGVLVTRGPIDVLVIDHVVPLIPNQKWNLCLSERITRMPSTYRSFSRLAPVCCSFHSRPI